MKRLTFLVPLLALLLLAACGGGSDLPKVTFVNAQGQRTELKVEVPRTKEGYFKGLMNRSSLPRDQGMFFVFPRGPHPGGFWMKDTQIPLTVAFVAEDGTIADIQDMQPLSQDIHNTPKEYLYGLEANLGWFQDHGIKVGDKVILGDLADLPSPLQ